MAYSESGSAFDSTMVESGSSFPVSMSGEGSVNITTGTSPYVGSDGYWYEYDDKQGKFVKTDTKAQGDKGESGADGISPTVTTTQTSTGAKIIITDVNGSHQVELSNGADGAKGDKGAKGDTGEKGDTGDKGDKGDTGASGYTPVRGTDYWTTADKNEIVNETKSALEGGIPTKVSELENDANYVDNTYHDSTKQDTLVSGTNIKTINNQSLLGEGNITIEGGIGSGSKVVLATPNLYRTGWNGGMNYPITLSQSIENFDEIYIEWYAKKTSGAYIVYPPKSFSVSQIKELGYNSDYKYAFGERWDALQLSSDYSQSNSTFMVTSATTITMDSMTSTFAGMGISKIYGIKY